VENDTIQSTTNYQQFKLLHNNREQHKAHVERLKKAFEEYGNLTKVQPILVNENFEIIDGQHRFLAAQELGLPIFYTIRQGLGIREARSMNILHKSWNTDDYARSYANSGDASYQRYLQLREDYPFSHSILLSVAEGIDSKGSFRDFREGNFTINPEQYKRARETLDSLTEITSVVPMGGQKEFGYAVLKAMSSPGYDHKRMVQKVEERGGSILRFAGVQDYLRALEELYNFKMPETSRVRLY
jgi:hypothetical protein